MTHLQLRNFLRANILSKRPDCGQKRASNKQQASASAADENTQRIASYYAQTSEGYRDWSQKLNMHFGTFEWGINPFNLERMLENTNRQVINSLQLTGSHNHLLDMGCGLGGTMRFAAQLPTVKRVTGVTIAANQVQEAQTISTKAPQYHKQNYVHANYHHTGLSGESFDGAYAIESACHSRETSKQSLINEAYRLLKPGSTLALCDGFMNSTAPMNAITRLCYRQTCKHWALGHFPVLTDTVKAMESAGFEDIHIQDLSWRILPSALYIPWMVLRYGTQLLLQADRNPEHWHHLLAPAWGLALACNRMRFGYYRVSAKKPQI